MRDVTPKQPEEYMVGGGPGTMMKKKKPDPIYPRIDLNLDTIPEAKKWDVGETYRIELEVKMVGLSIGKQEYNNRAEFEIHKIGTEDSESEQEDKGEAEE